MPRDDEETCGNYDCPTCYPGGVVKVETLPESIRLRFSKAYEM